MKGFLRIALVSGSLIVAACVNTESYEVFSAEKVEGPRELAISGVRAPWVIEIEKRLRVAGFSVKRWASHHRTTQLVGKNKLETYDEATTQVILMLDGYAPNTAMTRCMGGGYKFEFIQAEVVDVVKNEVIASYSNSGYSENCPPLSGTIFADIVSMVEGVF